MLGKACCRHEGDEPNNYIQSPCLRFNCCNYSYRLDKSRVLQLTERLQLSYCHLPIPASPCNKHLLELYNSQRSNSSGVLSIFDRLCGDFILWMQFAFNYG
jgi:hypothetical protein